MSIKEEIIRTYKRAVISCPEGAVVHMGDCNLYNTHLGVCTCGLHHWLWQGGEEVRRELYPKFMDEIREVCNKGFVEYLLQEFELGNLYTKDKDEFIKVEKPEPMSDKELDEVIDKIREIFEKKRKDNQ